MKAHIKKNMTRKEFKSTMMLHHHVLKYNGAEINFRPALKGVWFAFTQTFYVMECHDKKNRTWFWVQNCGLFWVQNCGLIHMSFMDRDSDIGTLFMYEGNINVEKLMKMHNFTEFLTREWHRHENEVRGIKEDEEKEKEDKVVEFESFDDTYNKVMEG